jgi:hypothetical protein
MNTFNGFKILLFIALATSYSVGLAQKDDKTITPALRQKIETARIALLSDRLALTSEQAEKFWPVYREFVTKRGELKKEFNQAKKLVDPSKGDAKQEQELIDFGFQIKQKELDLEKEYSAKILLIITPQQLLSLKKAEQDFRQLILEQIQQRRAQQQRKENFRDKNQKTKEN